MIDGFNEGWIEVKSGEELLQERMTLEAVLRSLVMPNPNS
jgi:hypothetical protein